jgi:hypothetical protein
MDGIRGAICFAMSISASMSVSGFERSSLETWRLSGKGVSQRARSAGATVRPDVVMPSVMSSSIVRAQRIACRSMSSSA